MSCDGIMCLGTINGRSKFETEISSQTSSKISIP